MGDHTHDQKIHRSHVYELTIMFPVPLDRGHTDSCVLPFRMKCKRMFSESESEKIERCTNLIFKLGPSKMRWPVMRLQSYRTISPPTVLKKVVIQDRKKWNNFEWKWKWKERCTNLIFKLGLSKMRWPVQSYRTISPPTVIKSSLSIWQSQHHLISVKPKHSPNSQQRTN